MKFKRLLMPVLVLGIMCTMGSMVYAQSTVTCGMTDAATTANIGPFSAINVPPNNGTAIAATNIATINGISTLGPSAHGANTGHTEVIAAGPTRIPAAPGGGTLRIWCVNPGPTTTPGVVVLTISFGVPITNTQSFPSTAAGIRVVNGSGDFVAAGPGASPNTAGANVGISSVSNSGGSIVIGLGTLVATSATPTPQNPTTGITFTSGTVSTFDLDGVLLSTNGKNGEIDATMTETSGNLNLTSTIVPVISAVTAPLVDPTLATSIPTAVTNATALPATAGGPAILNSAGNAIKGNFTVRVAENFPEMWQSAAQYNGGAVFPASPSSSTQVNFIFKNVPAGLNISNCIATLTDPTGTTSNPNTAANAATASSNSITAASNIITVNFTNNVDPAAIDVLWLSCTSISSGTATLPLPAAAVTVQVEMGPLGTALTSLGAAQTGLATGLIPRYQDTPQPAAGIPVILFPPSQTTLLITYAVVVPGFNTGIAISNTTNDPFGSSGGGATPTPGTIVFTLFKNDGTTKTFTTASVAAGTTYAANLSDILSSAGAGTTFSGYIFAQANFPQAHGAATIYDTSSGHAALSTPVLVVTSGGNQVTLANPRLSPESFGQ
jgi:hypothetical protein